MMSQALSQTTINPGKHQLINATALVIMLSAGYQLLEIQVSEPLFPSSSDKVYALLIGFVMSGALLAGSIQTIGARIPLAILTLATVACITGGLLAPQKGDGAVLTAWSAQLFFLSRPVSIAAGTLAMVYAFGSALNPHSQTLGRVLGAKAHWWALLAGTVFLGGEIMGSYWSFVGWGRSWSWSAHFYFSALTYLLWILVFHIPRSWARNERRLRLAQASILLITLLLNLGYRIW